MRKADFLYAILLILVPLTVAADDTTVANDETPSGKRYTLVLEENLRVGPDQDDNFLWPSVGTIVQTDEQGTMYVTGVGDNRVTVIDPKGAFVRHIGGKGQGPGEYQGLVSFQILADGRGVAFETLGIASSLSWYDKDLKFVEKNKVGEMGKLYQSASLSPNGELAFSQLVTINQAEGKMDIGWVVMGLDGAVKADVASFSNPMPTPDIVQSTDKFAAFMAQMLTSQAKGLLGFATFDDKNNVYTAVAKDYAVTRWDPAMNKQLVITRKYKPIPQTEEEIEAVISPILEVMQSRMPPQMSHLFSEAMVRQAVKLAEFPPVKHPVNGLAVLEDGTVCVIHNADLLNNRLTIDLFSAKGQYLGDFTIPMRGLNSFGLVFSNGHLYRIESNDDDDNMLVRYNYKLAPAK